MVGPCYSNDVFCCLYNLHSRFLLARTKDNHSSKKMQLLKEEWFPINVTCSKLQLNNLSGAIIVLGTCNINCIIHRNYRPACCYRRCRQRRLEITKEAGPEIFVQSHSLIVPSGSLEARPSREMLSVGKVITWSGPAIEMVVCFFLRNFRRKFLF